MEKIKPGISKNEVLRILGKPDKTYGDNQFVYSMEWDNYFIVGFSNEHVKWTSVDSHAAGPLIDE